MGVIVAGMIPISTYPVNINPCSSIEREEFLVSRDLYHLYHRYHFNFRYDKIHGLDTNSGWYQETYINL